MYERGVLCTNNVHGRGNATAPLSMFFKLFRTVDHDWPPDTNNELKKSWKFPSDHSVDSTGMYRYILQIMVLYERHNTNEIEVSTLHYYKY